MPRDNFGFEVECEMNLVQHTANQDDSFLSPRKWQKGVLNYSNNTHQPFSITPNLTSKPHLFAFILITSYLYLYEGSP